METEFIVRAARLDDVPGLTVLANLPGYRHGTLRLPFETEEGLRHRLFGPNSANSMLLVADAQGLIIGSASLHTQANRRRHVGAVGMGVHDDFLRQGVGRALLTKLLDVADNWLGLRRIELEVNVDNAAAIALYESVGFLVEGTARQAILRDGVLVDSHWMARLRDAPRPSA